LPWGGAFFAIGDVDWKLVLGKGWGGREKRGGKRFARPWTLFNLAEDLGETTDLYEAKPEIAEKLELSAMQIITAGKSR
ncbi:MAG: Cerebroside-sulfatase, partial [Verrucomicrobiota bacterium]